LRNITTKSVILAPFNSTISKSFSSWSESVKEMITNKNKLIKFGPKAKELDRQYEMNNNCELDNGVYNNFAYKSPTSEDEAEEKKEAKKIEDPSKDNKPEEQETKKHNVQKQIESVASSSEHINSSQGGQTIEYQLKEQFEMRDNGKSEL
jgi:hypothetical protein